jgi:hypothetical protein
MFGLFRNRAKNRFPDLSAADQAIIDERQAAYSEVMKSRNALARASSTVERAYAQAAHDVADERWNLAVVAHAALMKRLVAEARDRLERMRVEDVGA